MFPSHDRGGPAYGSLSASRIAQLINQEVATPGQMIGIRVENGGSGYSASNPPTVTINTPNFLDDNYAAKAYARINDAGQIFQIVMKDSVNATEYSFGQQYDQRAYITLSGGAGSGARLVPEVFLDSGGMAFDPRNDLNASALMYTARIIGDEYKIFNISNDFRQVGLIRNPLKDSTNDSNYTGVIGDSAFTGVRGNALRKIYVAAGS